MKHQRYLLTTLALPLCLLLSLAATASTVTINYAVSAAVSDPAYYGPSHRHALYLPAFATDMVFNSGALFTIFDDGTATLTASAVSLDDAGLSFDVALSFTGITDLPGSIGPKKELHSHAYYENDGPVATDTWFYFESWGGLLTGTGNLAGINLTLVGRGAPFQWGAGANGKNIEFGGSGWFYAFFDDGSRSHGDFNLNAQPVPVPASFPILVMALMGMGIISKRGQPGS